MRVMNELNPLLYIRITEHEILTSAGKVVGLCQRNRATACLGQIDEL